MLQRWTIGNFKSFSGDQEIEFGPITIIAGANSSGKSSIIQSILLIKQTLQYAPQHRPIGLNGPLLKLGRFNDVHCSYSNSDQIHIGWSLTELGNYGSNGVYAGGLRPWNSVYRSQIDTASFDLKFALGAKEGDPAANSSEIYQLQPLLDSVTVKADAASPSVDGKSRRAEIRLQRRRELNYPLHRMEGQSPSFENTVSPYLLDFSDADSIDEITGRRPESGVLGFSIRHFMPATAAYRYNRRKFISSEIAKYICGPSGHYSYVDADLDSEEIPAPAVDVLMERLLGQVENTRVAQPELFSSAPFNDILRSLKGYAINVETLASRLESIGRSHPRHRPLFRAALADAQEEFEKALLSYSDTEESAWDFGQPRLIRVANEQTGAFFQSSIHYLGPLRDEPKPIYPLEALINPKDVGYRGEHTAAVLDLHRDTQVLAFESNDVGNLHRAEPTSRSLHAAVVDWLSYLGVADSVSTSDLGKMGHQMQVRVDATNRSHDLTNVGVGVSQLLPIVVMSLLADSPCLLVFEQPELHLHPKVQARLADFFFSLSLLGKQCILETHSEYLVERFRRRIAEAPGNELGDQVRVYFTQKTGGVTHCREVKITKFGAVLDWPQDFFDQSLDETEHIIRAAQKKRSVETGRDRNR